MTAEQYIVHVPQSTVRASDPVSTYVEAHGPHLVFDHREAAEALVRRLAGTGSTDLALQSAAPQDASDVDAYLVVRPDRRPTGTVSEGLTFQPTATQYGAIGEILITSHRTDPPPIVAYARSDLELDEAPHVELVAVDRPVVARDPEGTRERRWIPDCRAVVRLRSGGPPLREYLIEIKSGRGSLLRDQLAVMQAAARFHPVLIARVSIDDLPERYTVRWESVDGNRDLVLESASPRQRSLADFD